MKIKSIDYNLDAVIEVKMCCLTCMFGVADARNLPVLAEDMKDGYQNLYIIDNRTIYRYRVSKEVKDKAKASFEKQTEQLLKGHPFEQILRGVSRIQEATELKDGVEIPIHSDAETEEHILHQAYEEQREIEETFGYCQVCMREICICPERPNL